MSHSISIGKMVAIRSILYSLVALSLVLWGKALRPELDQEFWQMAELWRDPLVAGALCGLALGFMGVYILLNRIVFVSLALAQGAGLGIFILFWACSILGYHLEHSILPFLSGLFFASLVMLVFSGLKRISGFTEESLIGLLYILASAGILLIGDKITQGLHDLNNLIYGNAVAVTPQDLSLLWAVLPVVILLHLLFRRQFLITSADPAFLQVLGMKVRPWRILLYVLFSVTITAALKVVGALPTFTLLLVPAFIGLSRSRSTLEAFTLSGGIGLVLPPLGYYYSYLFSFPTGASMVLVALFFLMALGLEFLFQKLLQLYKR